MKSGTLKEADADRIVEEIARLGIPSMVATDVNPAPSFVLKVAARFNVRVFSPMKSMLENDKDIIAPEAPNAHERDAIAAAVKCYRMYANRLRQIELLEGEADKDMLKHLVIQGFTLRNAVALLEAKRGETDGPDRKAVLKKSEKPQKDGEVLELAKENVNLRKALEQERGKIAVLEEELRKARRERYAEIGKDAEVRRLKSELQRMGWLVGKLRRKIARG